MRIRRYTDQELAEAIRNSFSWGSVIRKLGLCAAGGTYVHIQRLANKLGFDSSHFRGKTWNKEQRFPQQIARRLDKYLVLNGPYISTTKLKEKLWHSGLKEKRCEMCGLTVWCGQPAPLELHHNDQNSKNNSFENLSILCANCHALIRVDRKKDC